MGILNAVVKTGSTGATIVGGVDQTFTPDGQTVANGVHIADTVQTDFRIRDNVTLKSKVPSLLPDGTYSKAKRSAVLVLPRLLADGKTVFNLCRIEVECHPEMAAAVELDLRMKAAQLITDADFTAFWVSGSLA
jgi:hypothetical protein